MSDDLDEPAGELPAFLAARGWSRSTAELVGLSVVQDHAGTYRVRFPFLRDGVALVWQDRAAEPYDLEPKWRAPKDAELYPFGLDCLSRYEGDRDTWPSCPLVNVPAVWVVEGPADAVTLLEYVPTVSVLGLPGVGSWRDEYAAALEGLTVVLVADNDQAGDKLRARVAESFRGRGELVHLHPPASCNDLGDWHESAGDRFDLELLEALDAALARAEGVSA